MKQDCEKIRNPPRYFFLRLFEKSAVVNIKSPRFPPYIVVLLIPALVKQPRVGMNWVSGVKLWDNTVDKLVDTIIRTEKKSSLPQRTKNTRPFFSVQ